VAHEHGRLADSDETVLGRQRDPGRPVLAPPEPAADRRRPFLIGAAVLLVLALAAGTGFALTSGQQERHATHRAGASPVSHHGPFGTNKTAAPPRRNRSTPTQAPPRPNRSTPTQARTQPAGSAAPAVPGPPQGFTTSAVEHGAHLSWSPPGNAGRTPISYNLSWSGGAETVAGTSASVGGLTNGQSYTFTLTAANSAGTGPPVSAAAHLTYPVGQFNAFDDQSGSVPVETAPAPSAHIGTIPQGASQPLTVICQTAGVSVSDPFQTWKSTDIWDEVQWNGGVGWVLDLYVSTPASAGSGDTPGSTPPGNVFSDPPLWHCQ